MIYFDNAATTRYKPVEVYKAFEYYMREIGVSPGRGSYSLGIRASRLLYQTRKKTGSYFGLKQPENVVFTKNSTEAINLFFNGFLKKGDHVVITCYEHNAVLRTLQKLKDDKKIEYSVIRREDLAREPWEIFDKYCKADTRVFASTLSSNLTGRIIFREDIFRFMQNKGITTFMDASQGAGKLRIEMERQGVGYLAFTGHKDLMAFPGVGGLCCSHKDSIKPLIQGGTGLSGDTYTNPDIFPEGLEAGTLNMSAIWSLNSAIGYVEKHEAMLKEKDRLLREYLINELSVIKNIEIYDQDYPGVGVVSFNINGYSSAEIVGKLDQNGICVRGGIHCAILTHEALNTASKGAVRVSFSGQNTREEIGELVRILKRM